MDPPHQITHAIRRLHGDFCLDFAGLCQGAEQRRFLAGRADSDADASGGDGRGAASVYEGDAPGGETLV